MKSVLIVHWLICALGLIGIVYGLARETETVLALGTPATAYNEWAIPFFNREKPYQLAFYVGGASAIFAYYVLVFLLLHILVKREVWVDTENGAAEEESKRFLRILVAISVAINIGVYAWFRARNNPVVSVTSFLLCGLWVSAVISPLFPAVWSRESRERLFQNDLRSWEGLRKCLSEKRSSSVMLGIVVVTFVQLVTIFLPYLRDGLLMTNEFMDVPEYTRMGGQLVSNAEYINGHGLADLLKFDSGSDHGKLQTPQPSTVVEIPHIDSMLGRGLANLRRGLDGRNHDVELEKLFFDSRERHERFLSKVYSAEETEFLQKNRLEMHWQILNRWVLHHHNFVLGPINAYTLGKPLQEISAQYGLGNAVFMAHLLKNTGGISYQNYFQKWYMFWPIYYALFVGVASLILRDVYYVALVCVLAFGFINQIDYQFLFLGPGLNPIRHFFDIPVVACLYLYLTSRKGLWLVAGFLMGAVGVLNNQQFGLFLVGALSVTLLIKGILDREAGGWLEFGWAVVGLLACGVALLVGSVGTDVMTPYYLHGFLGAQLHTDRVIAIMLAISAGYAALLIFSQAACELKYVALFLLLYAQGLLLYYVWGGTEKHLLNIAPLLVLASAVFLRVIMGRNWARAYEKVSLGALIGAALLTVYVPGVFAYYSAKRTYEAVFSDHKVYDWNLERARFRSTMDPKYFVDSLTLIREYAKNEEGIYIISKYDNFLPFLANKYSAMPFFDLQWFLLSAKETAMCVDQIKTIKPRYLFVDTDIERNFDGEVMVVAKPPFTEQERGESLLRVQRLRELQKLFRAVKEEYVPVKQGFLLTVYQRRGES